MITEPVVENLAMMEVHLTHPRVRGAVAVVARRHIYSVPAS